MLRFFIVILKSDVVPCGDRERIRLLARRFLSGTEEVLEFADFAPFPAGIVRLGMPVEENNGRLHVGGVGTVLEPVVGDIPHQAFNEEAGDVAAGYTLFRHLVGQGL